MFMVAPAKVKLLPVMLEAARKLCVPLDTDNSPVPLMTKSPVCVPPPLRSKVPAWISTRPSLFIALLMVVVVAVDLR